MKRIILIFLILFTISGCINSRISHPDYINKGSFKNSDITLNGQPIISNQLLFYVNSIPSKLYQYSIKLKNETPYPIVCKLKLHAIRYDSKTQKYRPVRYQKFAVDFGEKVILPFGYYFAESHIFADSQIYELYKDRTPSIYYKGHNYYKSGDRFLRLEADWHFTKAEHYKPYGQTENLIKKYKAKIEGLNKKKMSDYDFEFVDYPRFIVNKVAPGVLIKTNYGIIDTSMKWVKKPAEDHNISSYKDMIPVKSGSGYAFTPIKRQQHNLIPVKLYNKEGYKKFGFKDSSSDKVVIPAKFDRVGMFNDGICWAMYNKKIGYIDQTGKFIIAPKYLPFTQNYKKPFVLIARDYANGSVSVKTNNGYIVLDKNQKKICAIPKGYYPMGSFHEGMLMVRKNKKYGFINRKGEIVIPAKFVKARNFYSGLACVVVGYATEKKSSNGWMYSYVNKEGKLLLKPQVDLELYSFTKEGLAKVYGTQGRNRNFRMPQ